MIELFLCLVVIVSSSLGAVVEDFGVFGPTELYDIALNEFIQLRRTNQDVTLDNSGDLGKSIHDLAVKRLFVKDDAIFNFQV
jgi:hypothetical protein